MEVLASSPLPPNTCLATKWVLHRAAACAEVDWDCLDPDLQYVSRRTAGCSSTKKVAIAGGLFR